MNDTHYLYHVYYTTLRYNVDGKTSMQYEHRLDDSVYSDNRLNPNEALAEASSLLSARPGWNIVTRIVEERVTMTEVYRN